jgi:bacterioferritin
MKGDVNITGILTDLLVGELTAIDLYLLHGEMFSNLGFHHLAERSLHESGDERRHAQALIQRILFLEGQPDLSRRLALKIGTTVPEMLQAELDMEYHVNEELRKAVSACEAARDYVTRDILTSQLEDSEMDQTYWLEKQLGLIGLVGLDNYQQSQMKPGESN